MLLSVTTEIFIFTKLILVYGLLIIFLKLYDVPYGAFDVSKYFSYDFLNFTCYGIFTDNFIFYVTKCRYLLCIEYIYLYVDTSIIPVLSNFE